MPIQIQCPSCGQALRVPETAIGKTVRCPKCQTTFAAAASDNSGSAPTPPAAANPFDFGPLPSPPAASDPFAGFGGGNPPKPAGGNPFASTPQSNAPVNPYSSPSTADYTSSQWRGDDGLPWDFRKGFDTFVETTKLIMTDPSQAFVKMRQTGDLMGPITYLMAGTSVGMIASVLWNVLFQAIGIGMGAQQGGRNAAPALIGMGIGMLFGMFIVILFGVLLLPIFVMVGAFIQHLFLMMTGAARRDFWVTYRVICWSGGACGWLNMIPFVGGMIASIWQLVASVIGLAKAHDTSVGKVVLAIVLQMVVCCGIIAAFVAIMFAFVFTAVQQQRPGAPPFGP